MHRQEFSKAVYAQKVELGIEGIGESRVMENQVTLEMRDLHALTEIVVGGGFGQRLVPLCTIEGCVREASYFPYGKMATLATRFLGPIPVPPLGMS